MLSRSELYPRLADPWDQDPTTGEDCLLEAAFLDVLTSIPSSAQLSPRQLDQLVLESPAWPYQATNPDNRQLRRHLYRIRHRLAEQQLLVVDRGWWSATDKGRTDRQPIIAIGDRYQQHQTLLEPNSDQLYQSILAVFCSIPVGAQIKTPTLIEMVGLNLGLRLDLKPPRTDLVRQTRKRIGWAKYNLRKRQILKLCDGFWSLAADQHQPDQLNVDPDLADLYSEIQPDFYQPTVKQLRQATLTVFASLPKGDQINSQHLWQLMSAQLQRLSSDFDLLDDAQLKEVRHQLTTVRKSLKDGGLLAYSDRCWSLTDRGHRRQLTPVAAISELYQQLQSEPKPPDQKQTQELILDIMASAPANSQLRGFQLKDLALRILGVARTDPDFAKINQRLKKANQKLRADGLIIYQDQSWHLTDYGRQMGRPSQLDLRAIKPEFFALTKSPNPNQLEGLFLDVLWCLPSDHHMDAKELDSLVINCLGLVAGHQTLAPDDYQRIKKNLSEARQKLKQINLIELDDIWRLTDRGLELNRQPDQAIILLCQQTYEHHQPLNNVFLKQITLTILASIPPEVQLDSRALNQLTASAINLPDRDSTRKKFKNRLFKARLTLVSQRLIDSSAGYWQLTELGQTQAGVADPAIVEIYEKLKSKINMPNMEQIRNLVLDSFIVINHQPIDSKLLNDLIIGSLGATILAPEIKILKSRLKEARQNLKEDQLINFQDGLWVTINQDQWPYRPINPAIFEAYQATTNQFRCPVQAHIKQAILTVFTSIPPQARLELTNFKQLTWQALGITTDQISQLSSGARRQLLERFKSTRDGLVKLNIIAYQDKLWQFTGHNQRLKPRIDVTELYNRLQDQAQPPLNTDRVRQLIVDILASMAAATANQQLESSLFKNLFLKDWGDIPPSQQPILAQSFYNHRSYLKNQQIISEQDGFWFLATNAEQLKPNFRPETIRAYQELQQEGWLPAMRQIRRSILAVFDHLPPVTKLSVPNLNQLVLIHLDREADLIKNRLLQKRLSQGRYTLKKNQLIDVDKNDGRWFKTSSNNNASFEPRTAVIEAYQNMFDCPQLLPKMLQFRRSILLVLASIPANQWLPTKDLEELVCLDLGISTGGDSKINHQDKNRLTNKIGVAKRQLISQKLVVSFDSLLALSNLGQQLSLPATPALTRTYFKNQNRPNIPVLAQLKLAILQIFYLRGDLISLNRDDLALLVIEYLDLNPDQLNMAKFNRQLSRTCHNLQQKNLLYCFDNLWSPTAKGSQVAKESWRPPSLLTPKHIRNCLLELLRTKPGLAQQPISTIESTLIFKLKIHPQQLSLANQTKLQRIIASTLPIARPASGRPPTNHSLADIPSLPQLRQSILTSLSRAGGLNQQQLEVAIIDDLNLPDSLFKLINADRASVLKMQINNAKISLEIDGKIQRRNNNWQLA